MSEEILRNPWLVNIVVMLVLIWFSVEDIRLRSIGFKGIMIVITAGIIYITVQGSGDIQHNYWYSDCCRNRYLFSKNRKYWHG